MIYDCFLFFNEFELLELRLNMLYNTVDFFVLVESNRTFTGIEKPFLFEAHKDKFKPFMPKIIYIPVYEKNNYFGAWERQYYQRSCILKGIRNAAPDDYIVTSDVDEIPDPTVLSKLVNENSRARETLDNLPLLLEQEFFYYFANCRCTSMKWPGTIICKKRNLFELHKLRRIAHSGYMGKIENSGWHFSYFGGIEGIKIKMQSISEQKFNCPEFLNTKNLSEAIKTGKDLFKRDLQFEILDLQLVDYWHPVIKKWLSKYPKHIHNGDM